jgi:hypothetical protein
MDEELYQAQFDFDALKPLLSDDDMGIGELEDDMEIPLQMLSPPRKNIFSKPIDPISVKPKVKLHKKGKNKMLGLIWNGRGMGSYDKRKHVRELVEEHAVDFIGI